MTSVLSPRAALSVDQRQAMHTAATRMCRDYADTFSIETIEEFLYSSYDTLALGAAITNYLPLLAERFARQRLTALATVEGTPRRETHCLVRLHPQHRALADGDGIVHRIGRRPRRGLVGRLDARPRCRQRGRDGDGRT